MWKYCMGKTNRRIKNEMQEKLEQEITEKKIEEFKEIA